MAAPAKAGDGLLRNRLVESGILDFQHRSSVCCAAMSSESKDLLAPLLAEAAEVWADVGVLDAVEIRFSSRLRTSLGRVRADMGRISLHAALATADRALLREVVLHELAHVVVFRRHGHVAPHGPEWQALMGAASLPARARMPLSELPPALSRSTRTTSRWRHHCPGCGAARVAKRPVRRWRCVRCVRSGGTGLLEIERVSA